MSMLNVSIEAIEAQKVLQKRLEELQALLEEDMNTLWNRLAENSSGLGAHQASIKEVVEQLKEDALSDKKMRKLHKTLAASIQTREEHRERSYIDSKVDDTPDSDVGNYIAGVMGRLYEGGYRKMREQTMAGQYDGNVFVPDANAVPQKRNPAHKTFGQITQDLSAQYGLTYTGTPYVDGWADFSNVSLAQVSLADIVDKHMACEGGLLGEDGAVDYSVIFSSRTQNFKFADEIAARAQVSIPGLDPGYSAADLEEWRNQNCFTWDESYLNGYLLVPSAIHNNISHTGLVGINVHSKEIEKRILRK